MTTGQEKIEDIIKAHAWMWDRSDLRFILKLVDDAGVPVPFDSLKDHEKQLVSELWWQSRPSTMLL